MQRFIKGCLAGAIIVAAMTAAGSQAEAGGGFNISIGVGPTYGGYPVYRNSYYGPYGRGFGSGSSFYGPGWNGGGYPYGYGRYGGYGGYGGYGHSCQHGYGW